MMNKHYPIKSIFALFFFNAGVMAQNLPVPDSEIQDNERTEVVCYAAENRWVCAPKGSEKPTAAIEQIKTEVENESETAVQQVELLSNDAPINPLDPPEGVESLTDTAPAKPIANPMAETPEDVITEQSPQATIPPETEQRPAMQRPIKPDEKPETTSQTADYAGDNWFERYPNHWTIQILGVANQHNLDAFIRQQQLNDQDYRIVETVANDAPWWVVIYGHYPNRDAADNARQTLPENLAVDAWLRPLASLAGEN